MVEAGEWDFCSWRNSVITSGISVGEKVCRILGLKPESVMSLSIHIDPDELVLVKATMNVEEKELEAVMEELRQHDRIVEVKGQ